MTWWQTSSEVVHQQRSKSLHESSGQQLPVEDRQLSMRILKLDLDKPGTMMDDKRSPPPQLTCQATVSVELVWK